MPVHCQLHADIHCPFKVDLRFADGGSGNLGHRWTVLCWYVPCCRPPTSEGNILLTRRDADNRLTMMNLDSPLLVLKEWLSLAGGGGGIRGPTHWHVLSCVAYHLSLAVNISLPSFRVVPTFCNDNSQSKGILPQALRDNCSCTTQNDQRAQWSLCKLIRVGEALLNLVCWRLHGTTSTCSFTMLAAALSAARRSAHFWIACRLFSLVGLQAGVEGYQIAQTWACWYGYVLKEITLGIFINLIVMYVYHGMHWPIAVTHAHSCSCN